MTPNAQKVVNRIVRDYKNNNEVCMGELLADETADGLTLEEAFEVYVHCMKAIEGNRFYVEKNGERMML